MKELLNLQRTFFSNDQTKTYDFRIAMLDKLHDAILRFEPHIIEALKKDLNKSSFEAYTTEIGFCLHSIKRTKRSLKRWMRTKKVKTPIYQLNTKSYLRPEPLGNVLIIGPYNYPFQLIIEPLIGAIAAGNTAILKPSEFTVHVEKVLKDMIDQSFDPAYIKVVTGDQTVTSELLALRFDHIFFTGSTRVGQIVYEAASKNLVPVTLELGGKSPTIVDDTVNLKIAARRIAFGKFINAGQTCIAPDYIYVKSNVHDQFVSELKDVIKKLYNNEAHFGRIVNERHFNRLMNLIDEDKIVHHDIVEPKKLFIGPTILKDVTWNDSVMKEEIFGPILPVLTYQTIDEVINILKQKEKPLALYLFSNHKETQQKVWNSLSFGGGAINDTLMHVSNPHLPFGGIGSSGIGSYHGYSSFEIFSHYKGYIKRSMMIDPPIAYPPYTPTKEKLVRRILK